MDYKQQYMDLFAYTRVLLGDDLEDNRKFIERGMSNGHQFSIMYLGMVADNLTAYNEMYPHPWFISLRFFRAT